MEAENRRVTVRRDFPEIFAPVRQSSTKGFSANEVQKRRFTVIRDFPENCGPLKSSSSHGVNPLIVNKPQKLKGKVEETKASEGTISRERAKVTEIITLFRDKCKEISRSGRGIRRVDTAALSELRKEGKFWNQSPSMLGSVPGVNVGDKFHYRIELHLVGLHKHFERGIDTMEYGGTRIATCIVANERHLDKMNDPNTLVYIGEGGVLRRREIGVPPDQELKGGNRALWTNMNEKKSVRVVRGLALNSGQKILYVYDGLYEVQGCKQKKGAMGNLIFEFQMVRCTGQPQVPWENCRRYQF
ncbi:unnamed protein product [Amaranthus hypochondriacus]